MVDHLQVFLLIIKIKLYIYFKISRDNYLFSLIQYI